MFPDSDFTHTLFNSLCLLFALQIHVMFYSRNSINYCVISIGGTGVDNDYSLII